MIAWSARARSRRRRAAAAAPAAPAPAAAPVPRPATAAPPPVGIEGVGEPQPIPPRWPRRLELDPDALDEPARVKIVDGLSAVDEPWAISVLAEAYEEEHDLEFRARILGEVRAVTARSRTAPPEVRETLERATRAAEPAERSVALEALADLGALDAVERGLDDPSLPVAQTALYALARNGARDRVAIYLRQAAPERAEALRAMLDMLDL